MQVLHPVCCGIDVHAAPLTACLRRVSDDGRITPELVDCSTTYGALIAVRSWWHEQQGPVVARERTGVYGKPVSHDLSKTVAVWVAKSPDVRQRPGTKTDVGSVRGAWWRHWWRAQETRCSCPSWRWGVCVARYRSSQWRSKGSVPPTTPRVWPGLWRWSTYWVG